MNHKQEIVEFPDDKYIRIMKKLLHISENVHGSVKRNRIVKHILKYTAKNKQIINTNSSFRGFRRTVFYKLLYLYDEPSCTIHEHIKKVFNEIFDLDFDTVKKSYDILINKYNITLSEIHWYSREK